MLNRARSAQGVPAGAGGIVSVAETARGLHLEIVLSGATFDGNPRRYGHGGARNRADRASDGLTHRQCQRIIGAAYRASAIGLAFNRFVTIHWELAGIGDARAAWATGRFIKLASDWLATRGGRFAWAWVRENGDGKGSHVHILLHVPPALARGFAAMQRRWLKRITSKPYRPGTIKSERVGGSLRAAETVPEHYAANLDAALAYVLKGASPDAARALGLERLEAGGRVIGKRSAVSQNAGR